MKALSINQPWAWSIVNGHKPLENRDWDTKYRGYFLVHAGKRIDHSAYEFLNDMGIFPPGPDEIETGGIVGHAMLINTVHIRDKHLLTENDRPWFFGEYGFMLDNSWPCELKPCKGALGFFTPNYEQKYVAKPEKKKRAVKPIKLPEPDQGSLV